MYPNAALFIATLFTIARTQKQAVCPWIDEWIKKLWYIYTMEYYSAIKKGCIWVDSNEVDKPRVHYTEWTQKKEDKYCILAIYMESRKMVLMILLTVQQRRCRHKIIVGEGEGGMTWDIYIAICKIDSQWEFAAWHKKSKAGALWQPRGME